ncbi:MAG: HAD-IIA family hydrolase [Acidimicrobiia bacterium]
MKTLICDLDGVVYLGDEEIHGAGAALGRLTAAEWNIVFCTNNSTRTPTESADKIRRVTGFGASGEMVATSAQAVATLLDGESSVLVLGGRGIEEAAVERGSRIVGRWQDADTVVVGLDPGLTYERLSSAVLAVRNGARFLASNHDPTYPTPEGLRPGAGALVAAVHTATGVEPVVAGKPHPPMRKLLAARARGDVWIVGDRDDTDLAMGRAEGWKTAHVRTGVEGTPAEKPTVEVADLAALADHLLR